MMMVKRSILILVLLVLSCGPAENPKPGVRLVAVGDVMLGRYIGKIMKVNGPDFPFERISSELRAADITFGNLEAIISTDDIAPAYPEKPYNFHATAEAAPALRKAGFTVLTLANNHAMDYGPEQLINTKELLKKSGMHVFGAGKDLSDARSPEIFLVKNIRFGFLGYGAAHARSVYAVKSRAGIAPIIPEDIRKDIADLRAKVDVLVVSLHWGIEYETKPTDQQRALAHDIIDWGADMIIGHHPHVMQGVEVYKRKIIAYSLGNFIFDQKGNGTDRSFMLSCTFRGKELSSAEAIPLGRFKSYFPKVAEGVEKNNILTDLKTASQLPHIDKKMQSVIMISK